MNYIVLDLEWNQPFTKNTTIYDPFHLKGEVIQIGAVKLDQQFQYVDNFKIDIAPKFYKKMNRHVKKLTGIDNQQLSYGFSFPDAFEFFRKWTGSEYAIITWGYDDVDMLLDNLRLHHIHQEIPNYYNLQVIFNQQISKDSKQWSLDSAMVALEIIPTKSAHDALHDSLHTSQICSRLDMTSGLLEYEEALKKMRAHGKLSVVEKDGYVNCNEALNDPYLRQIRCPYCFAELPFKPWASQSRYKQISTVSCNIHGEFFVRIQTIRKKGHTMSSQIVYEMSDEKKALYLEKSTEKCSFQDK